MIKRTRLMEYIRVLSDAEQILSEYDTDKRVVMDDIELELSKIGGNSLLKNMIEDYLNIAEDKAFLAGLYYGTHIMTLVKEPVVLPEEY